MKTRKMKKTTLTKTTLITFSLAFAFTGKGQVKVDPNNNVLVGQHWGQNAYKEFDVRGEMFVSHFPRNGVLGWNYVGCWKMGILDFGLFACTLIAYIQQQYLIAGLSFAIDLIHTVVVTYLLLVGKYKDGKGNIIAYPGQKF